ncbi:hypothetical protein Tco_0459296 [Tanacetum coccineum]
MEYLTPNSYAHKISKGKGSQRKKTAYTTEETVDVSKESDSKPARKRSASRRVVKKKVTITVDDKIDPEPDVALELGKSISLTEAVKEEAARQVHATHARIVTEPVPEPARRRPSGIAFKDTSRVSKKMSSDLSQKLKGVQTLTPEEQIAADTMKALKESKKTSRRQPGTRGSSEETGISPGVLNKSTVIPVPSSERTESEYIEEEDDDETIEWVDTDEEEDKKDDDDDKSIDLEQTDDEETGDEFMHESGNGDEEITDAAKVDAGNTEEPVPEPSKIQTPTIDLEPESEKSASEIRKIKKEEAEKQKMPKYIFKSTEKAALKEYD